MVFLNYIINILTYENKELIEKLLISNDKIILSRDLLYSINNMFEICDKKSIDNYDYKTIQYNLGEY